MTSHKEVIIGRPGTGKTRTLKDRIATAFHDGGHGVDDITATTFRRSMANELKADLVAGVSPDFKNAEYVTTTHGICKRRLGLEKDQVVNERDRIDFSKVYRRPYRPAHADQEEDEPEPMVDRTPYLNQFFAVRSWSTLMDLPLTDWPKCRLLPPIHAITTERLADFTGAWTDYKADHSLFDFDDMLLLAHNQRLCPDTPFLAVDEFQDQAPKLYAIYKMWEEQADQVVLAGDPDQSIYTYMGASPAYFERELGEADKVTVLGQSYRVPSTIWQYATNLLNRAGIHPPEVAPAREGGELVAIPGTQYPNLIERLREVDTLHLVRARYMKGRVLEALDFAGVPHNHYTPFQLALLDAIRRVRANQDLDPSTLRALVKAYPRPFLLLPKKEILENLKDSSPLPPPYSIPFLFTADARAAMLGPAPFKPCLEGTVRPPVKVRLANALRRAGGQVHRVSTIHGAKGTEAEVVVLHDASTERIERNLSNRQGAQEEARVLYVACTRASGALYLVQDLHPTPYKLPLPPIRAAHYPAQEVAHDAA